VRDALLAHEGANASELFFRAARSISATKAQQRYIRANVKIARSLAILLLIMFYHYLHYFEFFPEKHNGRDLV